MTRSRSEAPAPRRHRLLAVFTALLLGVGWLGVATPAAVADGPTTFSNSTSIAIPATGSANQMGPASPYPSNIPVSGMSGAVTKVTVTFNNLTHTAVNDIDAMVVAPTGANLIVLSDIGDPTSSLAFASNATLTFDDSAAGPVPTGRIPTGTYKPTNNGGGDPFPSPAPTASSQTTLSGAFTGINPNGTWKLYVVDDTSGDIGTMSGGWSLTITTEVAAVPTATSVVTSGTPSITGDPVTFTATVTANGSPVTAGSVQFSDNGTALGSPVALNASGKASLTTSALTEGTHEIRATYSGATGFLTSNGGVTQRVDNATVVTGNTFCNPGHITVPTQGTASPYPSNITVSGLSGQITKVTATLKGLSHQVPVDLDVMLAGPSPTTNVTLLSDSGGNSAVSGLNVTFDDAAAGPVPSPIVSGTFRPTDDDTDGPDSFPAPAPTQSNATRLSTFNGASANGTWSLWIVDDASGDSGSVANGWCLTVMSLKATQTALTSSVNPSTFGQSVTFTAAVTSGGTPVTSGSVQFTDGGSALGGPVSVGSDGKATFTTSALTAGTHAIKANYAATSEFGASSDSLSQVVNQAATTTTLAANPNPSTVGQSVTFSATVVTGGSPLTSGTVTFSDGGNSLGPGVPLAADGTATFTTSSLSAGTHPIRAAYSGTANLAASHDDVSQVVNKLATSTALTSDTNPSNVGQPVTFTATVTSGGAPVTSGSVTFSDGATPLGAAVPLGADGTASFTTSALAAGTHTISAAFSGTATLAGSDDDLQQVVNKLATSTGVVSSLNPSTVGQPVTFTATVTSSGAPVTSGSVTFSEGGTPLGAAVPLAANGTATFTTAGLPVGTHTVEASYGGTAQFAASSGSVDQVVNPAPTSTAVASAPNPSTFGQSVTFTATVTSGGVPLTSGTVTFTEGGTPLGGPVPLAADGTATFSTHTLAAGSHTITATYSGTPDFAGSTGTVDQVVNQATTSTAVTSAPNPSTFGQSVTLTATVTSGGVPLTSGTVTFTEGGTTLGGPVPLAADGTATFGTSSLSAGRHIITATYSGTPDFAGSTGMVDQVVNQAESATALTSDANPSAFGQPVTFTATVTSSGSPHTSGTVTFTEGGAVLGGPVPLAPDGTATFSTDTLAAGTHTITATYSGTADLTGSSASLDQIVNRAGSATVVSSDPNPSSFGQPVTFTATVASSAGLLTTGTVTFTEGGTTLGAPVPLGPAGTATFTTSSLSAGRHTITATYSGTPDFAGSAGSGDQVVNQATTSTLVTSAPNPSTFGQSVTFTATVTSGGVPLTSGTVTFTEGGTTLGGPVPLAADGTATFSTDTLTAGSHTITATYSGTTDFAGSTGRADQVVNPAESTTALRSDANPSSFGNPVTFTATVTSGANPVGEGSVTFSVDGTVVQLATAVNAAGQATYTTSGLAPGPHTILAEYSGSPSYLASENTVQQSVVLVADAGGPYRVSEGDGLTLDASSSSPGATTYEWDVNGDGVFGDAMGVSPTLSWADLEALGINDGPASFDVKVRVTAGAASLDSAATALAVVNTAPAATITGGLTATVGMPFTVKVGANDPSSADMAALFSYSVDWGDGSPVQTLTGSADPPVTHTYATAGQFAASVTATDKDGGQGDPTVVQVNVEPAQESPTPTPSPSSPAPSTSPPTTPAGSATSPMTTPAGSATSSTNNGLLASTGASSNAPVALGGLFLLAGATLLFTARRRRSARGLHE